MRNLTSIRHCIQYFPTSFYTPAAIRSLEISTRARFLSYRYTKRLDCAPQQIYDIVLDVKDYKHFVPYVIESGHDYQYPDPKVSKGHGTGYYTLKFQTFTEKVECQLDFTPSTIISKCHTGQFNYLQCTWTFESVKNKFTKKLECNVTMDLNYEFKSFIYNQLSQLFTNEVSRLVVISFERRLKQLNRKRL